MAEREINRTLQLLFLSVLIFISFSCREPEPYQLGFIGSLSGNNSDLGIDGRNGYLLAVEEINRAGGIHGHLIETVIRNGEMNPTVAANQIDSFHKMGIEAVIGPFTSAQVQAVMPLADKFGVLVMSPTASSNELVGHDDMLIRAYGSTRDTSTYYADYLINTTGFRKAGIIYDSVNSLYTESWKSEFKNRYESLGGMLIFEEAIDARLNTQFDQPLDHFLASGSDCLILVTNSIDASSLIQHLRLKDRDTPVFVSEWASTLQLIELGGKSVDGTVVLQSFNPFDNSPDYIAFKDLYIARFNSRPSFAAVLSYESTHIIARSLLEKKKDETLKEAILRLSSFKGLQEDVIIDEYGDAHRHTVFSIIENGIFRKLE